MQTAPRIAILPLALWALAPAVVFAENPVVATRSGRVEGVVAGGVIGYKGIAFAAPPVGELRWRAPQPAGTWKGVRQAAEFGHDCMQIPFPSDAAPLGAEPAEDCLYLNVWRPAARKTGEKFPVLVWVYGGGFVNGGASPAVYDGSAFARQGVVFVSFNYRLGRFGFFAHPALTAAREGALGNYALMDQIAALEWVQRNIAAFGGDGSNVTIVGESAGGRSVLALLSTSRAEGLFAKAIVMSGGGRTLFRDRRRVQGDTPTDPSGETVGLAFAKSVGIAGEGPEALAALRSLSPEQVMSGLNLGALFAPPQGPQTFVGGPMIDGEIVKNTPEQAFSQGKTVNVPLMIGTTSQELGFNRYPSKDALFASFGPLAEQARRAYDADGAGELRTVGDAVAADRGMQEPARFIAREMAKRGAPVYVYRFGYVAESMRGAATGAFHASDIPFFFDTVGAKYQDGLTENDAIAAQQANAYFVHFAKTGDPNDPGLPHWSAYSPRQSNIMQFSPDQGPIEHPDPWTARLDLIEKLVSEK